VCVRFETDFFSSVALNPNFGPWPPISVTISRTLGRTPWTGDQLVARTLLTAPGDCDDGEVRGMKRFLAGETQVLGENLIRRHFVHHKMIHFTFCSRHK
jgi:hypothetical protein